jgi:hypothetical protein
MYPSLRLGGSAFELDEELAEQPVEGSLFGERGENPRRMRRRQLVNERNPVATRLIFFRSAC